MKKSLVKASHSSRAALLAVFENLRESQSRRLVGIAQWNCTDHLTHWLLAKQPGKLTTNP
jgi:hypothetical protein